MWRGREKTIKREGETETNLYTKHTEIQTDWNITFILVQVYMYGRS